MLFAEKYKNRLLNSNSLTIQALVVIVSSLILAAASQISIPWQPVPFTFQSAMVVMLGLALGARRATLAVALYLFEAAIGLPVLAGFSAGLPIMLGATAGYLFGFLPAAYLTGWMMEQGMAKSFITTFVTALIGAAVIFACGVLHLQTVVGWNQALIFGLKPFLLTEPVKLIVAALIAVKCWKQ